MGGRFLRITERGSGKVVEEIEVTGKSERQVERVERGILRQLNVEEFYIDDSACDEVPEGPSAGKAGA